MKIIKKLSLVLACVMLAAAAFTSCDWDTSPEPEHPLYVTYSVTAGYVTFIGPDQLLTDIQTWIKANQIVHDEPVNYTTGEASEFEKTDANYVKKYEEFVPRFKSYLNDVVMTNLNAGNYDNKETNTKANVVATFFVSASRVQGQNGNLKYEEFKFSYP